MEWKLPKDESWIISFSVWELSRKFKPCLKGYRLQKSDRFLFFFLLPCFLYITIWRIMPAIYTFYLSFHSYSLISREPPNYVGLENYFRLISDPRFINSLKITGLFTVMAVCIELAIGTGMAVLLDQKLFGKGFFQTFFLVPMFITPVAVGTVWYILFNDVVGPINYFLDSVAAKRINWVGTGFWAFLAILISDVWHWAPFMFLLVFAALQNIDPQLYEAAKLDGAGAMKLFRHITLPLLRQTMLIAAVFRSMDAFRIFDKVYVLTFGGPGTATETISILIFKNAFRWFNLGYAGAMVTLLLGILSVIYYLFLKKTGMMGRP